MTAPDEHGPRIAAWERRTDLPLTVVGVAYLVAYATQVLATRPGRPLWSAIEVVLWVVWALFAADFVGRVVVADRRLRYVARHPFDLLVVLAPFLRFLRLLRLVTVVSSLARVLRDDFRGRVGSYLLVSVSLVSFVAALAVYEVERDAPEATITSFGDALWWVLTTITTVGYGDRYPVTVEGRLVAAGLMLGGIAILGTVTAAIASWFLEQVGASDPAEALPSAQQPSAGPTTSPTTTPTTSPTTTPTTGAASAPAAPSETAELLAEIRALRARLDRLEGAADRDPGSAPTSMS